MAKAFRVKRDFVYIVTGELRIKADNETKARTKVRDALLGLEWMLWNTHAEKMRSVNKASATNARVCDYEI